MSDDRNIQILGIVELVSVKHGEVFTRTGKFLVAELDYGANGCYLSVSRTYEGPLFESRHDAEHQLLIDVTHSPPWIDEISIVNKDLFLGDSALSWTDPGYPDYEAYPHIGQHHDVGFEPDQVEVY